MDNRDELASLRKLAMGQQLPLKIGRYEVEYRLGQGGMGRVYKAFDPQLGRYVAIKILLTDGEPEDQIKRVLKEAQLSAKLHHPNIVTVYEVELDAEQPYIAMEYLSGETIAAHIKQDVSVKWCLKIIRKVALALYHAHREGIIHRDIKPANIILVDNCQPKLMDFGLAKMLNVDPSVSSQGMIIGTPFYIPPEQINGQVHKIDQRSDIYGIGATLYEMLTGIPPFYGSNIVELAMEIMKSKVKPPSELNSTVTRELDMICMKCLQKSRSKRYQTAFALVQDIDRYLNCQPITIYSQTSVYRMRKWAVRKKRLSGGMALSMVSILAISMAINLYLMKSLAGLKKREKQFAKITQKEVVDRSKRMDAAHIQHVAFALEDKEIDNFGILRDVMCDIGSSIRQNEPYSAIEQKFSLLCKLFDKSYIFFQQWGKFCLLYALRAKPKKVRIARCYDALKHFDRALEIKDDDYESAFLAYQTCQKHYGDIWTQLATHYTKKLQNAPQSYYNYIAAYMIFTKPHQEQHPAKTTSKKQRLHRVLQYCRKALAADPNFAHAYALKARAFLALSQFEHALRSCEMALELYDPERTANKTPADNTSLQNVLPHPDYANFLEIKGYIQRRSDWKKAIATFTLALNENPGSCTCYTQRGICHMAVEDYPQAIADFTAAIHYEDGLAKVFFLRIDAFLKLKKYQRALLDCQRLLEIHPHPDTYIKQVHVYQQSGDYDSAFKHINKAIHLFPEMPKLYLVRANLYSISKKSQQAIADIRTAAKLKKMAVQGHKKQR